MCTTAYGSWRVSHGQTAQIPLEERFALSFGQPHVASYTLVNCYRYAWFDMNLQLLERRRRASVSSDGCFLLGGLDDLGGLKIGRCLHGATWVRKGAGSALSAMPPTSALAPQRAATRTRAGPPQYQHRGGDPVLGRLPGVRAQPRGVVVHVLVLSRRADWATNATSLRMSADYNQGMRGAARTRHSGRSTRASGPTGPAPRKTSRGT